MDMHRLGLLVLAAGAITAACQGGAAVATPAPTTFAATPAPLATVAPTTAITPAPTLPVALQRPTGLPTDGSCEDADSSCLGVLEAGKGYTSKVFKPTVTFTMPVAGFINQFDGAGDIGLQEIEPSAGDAVLFFNRPRSVDASVGSTVDDIAGWLATNADLSVTTPKAVKLGGLRGVVLDVTVSSSATGGSTAGCPVQVCVDILRGDDPNPKDLYPWHWDWGLAGPEKFRLYLLDGPDNPMAVVVDSVDGTTYDAIIGTWEKIAPTVKFG
jgi:hypothetical protein